MRYPTRTDLQNEMLRATGDRIRQHPQSYNQFHWFKSGDSGYSFINEEEWLEALANPDCGATACLAGQFALTMQQAGIWQSEDVMDTLYRDTLVGEREREIPLIKWKEIIEATGLLHGKDDPHKPYEFLTREAGIFQSDATYWPQPYKHRWFVGTLNNDPEAMAKAGADLLYDLADGLIWWDEEEEAWVTIEEYIEWKDEQRVSGENRTLSGPDSSPSETANARTGESTES